MLFLDTYAMIEIINGNPKYKKYAQQHVATNIANLYELYYRMLEIYGHDIAKIQFKRFESVKMEIKMKHIAKASEVKLKEKISYADALGYAMAQIEGMNFLTGDNDFKDLEGVEFVK